MKYYPKQYDKKNHEGYTKEEILKISNGKKKVSEEEKKRVSLSMPGWNIQLLEEEINIQREGEANPEKGTANKKRKRIEHKKMTKTYLKDFEANKNTEGH